MMSPVQIIRQGIRSPMQGLRQGVVSPVLQSTRQNITSPVHGVRQSSIYAPKNSNPGETYQNLAQLIRSERYEEFISLIRNAPGAQLDIISNNLPIELILNSIPRSFAAIEALYSRGATSVDGRQLLLPRQLQPDYILAQIAYWLGNDDDEKDRQRTIKNELRYNHPQLRKLLHHVCSHDAQARERTREKCGTLSVCVEGLSQHEPIRYPPGTTKTVRLHDAIQSESILTIHRMKSIVKSLDEISVSPQRSSSCNFYMPGPFSRLRSNGPVTSSLAGTRRPITFAEIEQRLGSNKLLLDVVEAAVVAASALVDLLGVIHQRVDSDEKLVSLFTELRRDLGNESRREIVLPVISNGCDVAIVLRHLLGGYVKLLGVMGELVVNMDVVVVGGVSSKTVQMKYQRGETYTGQSFKLLI